MWKVKIRQCSTKKPKFNIIIFYKSKKDAVKNRYRACKICTP
ncbi:Ada metal-binding domain-containing protein [Phocoenobacter skyensis]